MSFRFHPAQLAHVDAIMWLFEDARKWHAEMHVSEWPLFEVERVVEDINSGRLMVLRKDDMIAGAVTITEDDPLIWTDDVSALYIHRLVVARHLKGANLGRLMVEEVDNRAGVLGKSCLRLDCWATNERLKRYYERLGFRAIRDVTIDSAPLLPKHYQGSTTTLFERGCASAVGSLSVPKSSMVS